MKGSVTYKKWETIQKKYDVIKNDASNDKKVVKELGKILASAYKIDKDMASDMWQNIIEAKMNEDKENAELYVVFIYKESISNHLDYKDSVEFISFDPNRMKLFIKYGLTRFCCDTDNFIEYILIGFLQQNNILGASSFFEFYYSMCNDDKDFYEKKYIIKAVENLCFGQNYYNITQETIDSFLDLSINKKDIRDICILLKVIYELVHVEDYEPFFEYAKKEGLDEQYADILWVARESYSVSELRDKWLEYNSFNEREMSLPHIYLSYEKSDSIIRFYAEVLSDSDKLIDYYFYSGIISEIEKYVIWKWIEEEKWDYYAKYLYRLIINSWYASISNKNIDEVIKGPYEYNQWLRERKVREWEKENTDYKAQISKKTREKNCLEYKNALQVVADMLKRDKKYRQEKRYIDEFIVKINDENNFVVDVLKENVYSADDELINQDDGLINQDEELIYQDNEMVHQNDELTYQDGELIHLDSDISHQNNYNFYREFCGYKRLKHINKGLDILFICRYVKEKIYFTSRIDKKKIRKLSKKIIRDTNYSVPLYDILQIENKKDLLLKMMKQDPEKIMEYAYEGGHFFTYNSFEEWINHLRNIKYFIKLRKTVKEYLEKKSDGIIKAYDYKNVYSGWPADAVYEIPKEVINFALEYKESKYDVKINIKGNYYCDFLKLINLIFGLEAMLYGIIVGYFSIYELESSIDEIVDWLEINIGYNRKTYYGNKITEFAYYIQEEIYDLDYIEEITKRNINILVNDLINLEKRICAYFRYKYDLYREKYAQEANEFRKIYEQL